MRRKIRLKDVKTGFRDNEKQFNMRRRTPIENKSTEKSIILEDSKDVIDIGKHWKQ